MVNTIIKSDNLHSLFQFNQKLSIAILLILISISFLIPEKYHYEFSNTLCLFLILTIGISHGALDHLKGKQLLKKLKKNNILYFYISYILLALLIILFWIILPSFTILLFLIIASYHFGKEDSFIEDHRKITNKIQIQLLLKGTLIIFCPIFFNYNETYSLFSNLFIDTENNIFLKMLNSFNPRENDIFSMLYWFIIFIIGINITSLSPASNSHPFFYDFFSIIFLNYLFNPLMAFTIYFCFIHSVRHTCVLIHELDKKNIKKGFQKFISKAFPLTLLTAILFLAALYVLSNYYSLNVAISKVIFIGLASLTFPHILLEYFLEKNEKRS